MTKVCIYVHSGVIDSCIAPAHIYVRKQIRAIILKGNFEVRQERNSNTVERLELDIFSFM